jgi:hypothetical protein
MRANARPILRTVSLLLFAGLSLYYAINSLWLGISLTRPMPYYDQWNFVHIEYFLYVRDHLPLDMLFRQTNEHRILTTRLVLLADAIWFDMRGYLPLFVSYATLGGTAWMLSHLALQPASRLCRIVGFLILLGVAWSISQWEVLGWAYEVFFPLQHFLALGALLAMANAVNSGKRRYVWLAVAILCNFLTIWSSGSGLFLALPVLLLCWWLQGIKSPVFVVFLVAHLLFVFGYLVGYQSWVEHHIPPWRLALNVLVGFLAWPFNAWRAGSVPIIGWIYLLTFAVITAVTTRKAWIARYDRNLIILVAFASYIFLEGGLLAYARPYNGAEARHATPTILFTAAMVAILWRVLSFSPVPLLRWAAPALAVFAIVTTNHKSFEKEWRDRAAFLDETIADVRAGVYRADLMKKLCPDNTQWLAGDLELLRAQRAGPFANWDGK